VSGRRRGFASDNAAGVHPQVLEAMAAVNDGHAFGYGHDPYTSAVEERVVAALGGSVEAGARAFFVFNGSGANVLSLRAACRPWQAVVCSNWAHINTDETGAPEAVGGLKLVTATAADGKLSPEAIEPIIARAPEEHFSMPRVLSVAQSTELGSVYSLAELQELIDVAHQHGLVVHVDGARLANAAAALGVGLAEITSGVGVDIVSFGGTKNGLMGCEAVVVLNPELTDGILYLRKQSLQLASKMRYLAAQFDALLSGDLWLQNASHANAMAARLVERLQDVPGVTLPRKLDANAVFAQLPQAAVTELLERFDFYVWDANPPGVPAGVIEVRWMCSWDTTEADIDAFSAAIAEAAAGARAAGVAG
jgi:threonine aldolase